jgi:uncharacterized protein (TIGR03084 family)
VPPSVADLCADLAAEQSHLDDVVANQPDPAWSNPTPAAGWDVRDSISHLCFFDEAATLALTDPAGFEALRRQLTTGPARAVPPDVDLGRTHLAGPAPLLHRWRTSRARTLDAIAAAQAHHPKARVPWFGPPMSVASFTTARMMETWAHGADIHDGLGVPLEATPRLRHVIHIGVNARPFSFAVHHVTDPGDPIRVEATAPDGTTWVWGADGADNRVTGPALDLALVLTQRRHRSRTGITVTGPTAKAWLDVAQAFAGRPTTTAPDR